MWEGKGGPERYLMWESNAKYLADVAKAGGGNISKKFQGTPPSASSNEYSLKGRSLGNHI